MSLKKEQILDSISKLSILDMMELISMMEKKFGVSADSVVSSQSKVMPEELKVQEEEQTLFNVILTAVGNNKIPVIKTVRSVISLGLKESKELVESAPVILKESVSKEDAESLKKMLEEVGASVEIK